MNKEKFKNNLCDYLKFCSNQMEKYAEKTNDPTLKTKYQQIAGINREFKSKFEGEKKSFKNVKLLGEIELLKNALICQKALYDAFALNMSCQDSAFADEMMDKQKNLCRELESELKSRKAVLE